MKRNGHRIELAEKGVVEAARERTFACLAAGQDVAAECCNRRDEVQCIEHIHEMSPFVDDERWATLLPGEGQGPRNAACKRPGRCPGDVSRRLDIGSGAPSLTLSGLA